MSNKTKIQWTDSTVNPVMGCSGCELWTDELHACYAGQLHARRPGHKGFATAFLQPKLFVGRMAKAATMRDLRGVRRLEKPWLDGLSRHIFISDMGDALSEAGAVDQADEPTENGEVPFNFLYQEIIRVVLSESGSRHSWQWLTKRPKRMAALSRGLRASWGISWPLNLWAGTSITTPATIGRVADIRQVGHDQTVRFLSAEPLLAEVSLAGRLDGINWVIVGGESSQGSSARQFECEWARRLRDECADAGVAFFVKQLGSRVTDNGKILNLQDHHGGNWNEWPEDLRIRQMPTCQNL